MWNMVKELDTLRRDMDRMFDSVGIPSTRRTAFLPGRAARQYPLINLYEDQENLYLEALMPGAEPKTLDVSLVEDALTISGEKPRLPSGHRGVSEDAYHRNERAAGRFVRTISLPLKVNDQRIKADYQHGVLWVTLPKAESEKPKRINVEIAA